MTCTFEDGNNALLRIHLDEVTVMQDLRRYLGTDDSGFFELAGDDRGMRGDPSFVGDESGRLFHRRGHLWTSHFTQGGTLAAGGVAVVFGEGGEGCGVGHMRLL